MTGGVCGFLVLVLLCLCASVLFVYVGSQVRQHRKSLGEGSVAVEDTIRRSNKPPWEVSRRARTPVPGDNKRPLVKSFRPVAAAAGLPVRRDGVVVFTDVTSSGVADAALELAAQGFHVLIGASSKKQERAFAYLSRKGLEVVPFALTDPSTYGDLVYRLRHIRRDLDRPVVSIVLNLADVSYDSFAYFRSATAVKQAEMLLDLHYANELSRRLVKSPLRVWTSLAELARQQTLQGSENEMLTQKLTLARSGADDQPMPRIKSNPPPLAAASAADPSDLGALRVVLLTSAVGDSTNREQVLNSCGLVCTYQQTTIDSLRMFARSTAFANLSVSTVESKKFTLESSIGDHLSTDSFAHEHIPWVMDSGAESLSADEVTQKRMRDQTRYAIVDALTSSKPLSEYLLAVDEALAVETDTEHKEDSLSHDNEF